MRIRWRNFELPSQVRLDRETATPTFGRFTVEPFEKGFGSTIGNGLRRVLLSSIEGTAVTWVRIDGVVHEFSTIQGVLEDVTQIVLNIKKLRVKLHTDAPTTLRIDANQRGEVRAEKIEGDLRVTSTVDLALSPVGQSLHTQPYVIWQDLRLIRARASWDAKFGGIPIPAEIGGN